MTEIKIAKKRGKYAKYLYVVTNIGSFLINKIIEWKTIACQTGQKEAKQRQLPYKNYGNVNEDKIPIQSNKHW